jgi:hypothetical protein
MTAQEKIDQIKSTVAHKSVKDVRFENQLGGGCSAWVIKFTDGSILELGDAIHFAVNEEELWGYDEKDDRVEHSALYMGDCSMGYFFKKAGEVATKGEPELYSEDVEDEPQEAKS